MKEFSSNRQMQMAKERTRGFSPHHSSTSEPAMVIFYLLFELPAGQARCSVLTIAKLPSNSHDKLNGEDRKRHQTRKLLSRVLQSPSRNMTSFPEPSHPR